jgi:glycosyltransferase involved in cell wall biosynthesis
VKTSIIIPALNEAESIGQVLSRIPERYADEILVIDGGSNDGTAQIAQSAGARVILEPRRGYGWACFRGAAEASGELLAFLDADGADDPRHLPALVTPILQNKADLVLGSRLAGHMEQGAMPWHQYFGNWLSAQLIRRLYGLPLTDLSPFRAVLRTPLRQLEMVEMTYGWPTEMIAKAARQNWRILEVPVDYHPRQGGKSKISGTFRGTTQATYLILKTILRYSGKGR